MGRRLAIGMLWAVLAYVAGALLGAMLVMLLSSNTHDKGLEAAMTGAFVSGPLVAIVGFVAGFARSSGSA